MMFRYQSLKFFLRRAMQPVETNLSVGASSTASAEHHPVTGPYFNDLAPDADQELPPVAEALRQLLSRPQAYKIGDLAALTDRLTSDLMLFSALFGHGHTSDPVDAGITSADETQSELHAAFIQELEA
jgi:hypothetical protein